MCWAALQIHLQVFYSLHNEYEGEMELQRICLCVYPTHPLIGQTTAEDRRYRLAVACVLLLCVLLLTATTVLWIKFSILNTEKDQLQDSHNTLIVEKEKLQSGYDKLSVERNQLQTSYMKMTLQRDYLRERTNNLTMERDQLQKMKDELQRKLNTLGEQILSDRSIRYTAVSIVIQDQH